MTPLMVARQNEADARAKLAASLSDADLTRARKAIAARERAEIEEAEAKKAAEAAEWAELEALAGANFDAFKKEADEVVAQQLALRVQVAASERTMAELTDAHVARFARRVELATKLGVAHKFGPPPTIGHARAFLLLAEFEHGVSPHQHCKATLAMVIAACFENFQQDLTFHLGVDRTISALLDGTYYDQRREIDAAANREGKRLKDERAAAAVEAARTEEEFMARRSQRFEGDYQ